MYVCKKKYAYKYVYYASHYDNDVSRLRVTLFMRFQLNKIVEILNAYNRRKCQASRSRAKGLLRVELYG